MLGLPAGVRSLVARPRSPEELDQLWQDIVPPTYMDVMFQCLARGLWYLVLVPTST